MIIISIKTKAAGYIIKYISFLQKILIYELLVLTRKGCEGGSGAVLKVHYNRVGGGRGSYSKRVYITFIIVCDIFIHVYSIFCVVLFLSIISLFLTGLVGRTEPLNECL